MTLTPTLVREYDRAAPDPGETETATFGLGCFWGPDARFGAMAGVVRTRVGYAGGTKRDPTYHALGDHTEVFQVEFDPAVLSYADLLDQVFRNHDPARGTSKPQYRNVVLAGDADQRAAVDGYLETRDLRADELATRIESLDRFYPAEDYHQKYSLRSHGDWMDLFDEAGYGDADLRESPAAAKLNGLAAGHDLPDGDDLAVATNRAAGPR